MALLHFHTHRCQAIVLEVGLGGRLDSTNVCSPSVVAITPIGLDHQHVLGNTLKSIAVEKAGIIKSSVPVVCGISANDPAQSEAIGVIEKRAAEQSAPLYLLDRDFEFDFHADPDWGSRVTFRGITAPLCSQHVVDLAMDGRHQAVNASVALAVTALVGSDESGLALNTDLMRDGIGNVRCEARIERFVLPDDVVAIVDAAHNEESMEALCQTIQRRRANRHVTIVFGTSHDKSAEAMLCQLAEIADRLILTQYAGNPRFQTTEKMLPLVPDELVKKTKVENDPVTACRLGLQTEGPGGMLVVCGSFFVAAETRQWLKEQETKNLRSEI